MKIQNLNYSPVLRNESKKALSSLSLTDFPHRRLEKWKYSKFGKLKKTIFHNEHSFNLKEIKDLDLPVENGFNLVFENGRINNRLSNIDQLEGLTITSFTESSLSIKNIINKYDSKYDNYFSFLNHGYLEDGLLLKVKKDIIIEKTVNIIYINTSPNFLSNTRLNIVVEDSSYLSLKQYFICGANVINSFSNHISEFQIGKSGKLKIDKLQDVNANFCICSENIQQEESSFFSINTFSNSGEIIRNNINVDVNGEFCHTELNGVFNPSKGQHIDQHTEINHLLPNCNSFENYKGIIRNNGIGVFNGKVIVHKDAQKIEAFQQNNNVLIDEDSQVYSKPELEIYADDVKCSHGSTTGQFDDQALFYLRSRGLSRSKAIDMLTSGFINEVIEKAEGEKYQKFLLSKLINS